LASKPKPTKGRKPDKRHVWLSEELGTSLVAESAFSTDPQALCARYNVSTITLERWRKKVAADERLAEVVAQKTKALDEVWEAGLRSTARELIAALAHHAHLALKADKFDPDMVHKLAGALKIVNDAAVTRGMVLLGQPAPNARTNKTAAKDAAVGDRASSGAVSTVGAGGNAAGAAPTAPTGGDPVH
jgi:hypothetical protein